MKLLTYVENGREILGVRVDAGVVDVAKALEAYPDAAVPFSMMDVIAGGPEVVEALRRFVDGLPEAAEPSYIVKEEGLTFGPCVTAPQKIICVGLNYKKHAEETKAAVPEVPILFNKFPNALTGHGADVEIPPVTTRMDYEVELAIVIGRRAKAVSEGDALAHVFGYCTSNDLSARDLQLRTPQWMIGKIGDGFCPLGPYLVTADEVGDPQQLAIRTTVNGEVRQQSNTGDMIFSCAQIVSYISQHLTLEPGDVILTGTPEGVILGMPKEQRVWLQPGDVVTVEVEKLGALTNRLVKG